jgi:hypothetical protein
VLELRIHGIANAPPADTLCTSDEKVERKEGDEQGSFWQITPTGRDGEVGDRRPPGGGAPLAHRRRCGIDRPARFL